jgi:hypothetical protein
MNIELELSLDVTELAEAEELHVLGNGCWVARL